MIVSVRPDISLVIIDASPLFLSGETPLEIDPLHSTWSTHFSHIDLVFFSLSHLLRITTNPSYRVQYSFQHAPFTISNISIIIASLVVRRSLSPYLYLRINFSTLCYNLGTSRHGQGPACQSPASLQCHGERRRGASPVVTCTCICDLLSL